MRETGNRGGKDRMYSTRQGGSAGKKSQEEDAISEVSIRADNVKGEEKLVVRRMCILTSNLTTRVCVSLYLVCPQ